MLASAAYSVTSTGCLILERKDFDETFVPPSITTDENAPHQISDIIPFNFDTMTELSFETVIYDSAAATDMEARWTIDGRVVYTGRVVPKNTAGGQARMYSDTIDQTLFTGADTFGCHVLTLFVSHKFYGDDTVMTLVPDSGDIASATWYVITSDSTHAPEPCQ